MPNVISFKKPNTQKQVVSIGGDTSQTRYVFQPERPSKPKGFPAGLTEREVQVLRLIARGDSNPQIAKTLFISVRTVSTHVTNILNCDNRAAAAAFAVKHDLI